jgi:hypothetical protein
MATRILATSLPSGRLPGYRLLFSQMVTSIMTNFLPEGSKDTGYFITKWLPGYWLLYNQVVTRILATSLPDGSQDTRYLVVRWLPDKWEFVTLLVTKALGVYLKVTQLTKYQVKQQNY